MLATINDLKVMINSREGFTQAEIEKHEVSCKMLESVVNTHEFMQRMLALKLTNTKGLANHEIYLMIRAGAEVLQPEVDHEIDVHVVIYHASNKTVGYTKPSTIKTWVNRKFFAGYEYAEVACNIFHEWLHKLGFDHVSAREHTSVPYALGYLVEAMIKEMIAGAVFTPINATRPVPVNVPTPVEKKVKCYRTWRTLWVKKVCYYE